MRIFRDLSPSAMAPILTFSVVALVCNIGLLVGGAGAAPLGLKSYVPARYDKDARARVDFCEEANMWDLIPADTTTASAIG